MIRWATFDCFGTLVDWRHGITTGIELLFPGRGGDLLEVYNRIEPRVQAEVPVRRYREVLAESRAARVSGNTGQYGRPVPSTEASSGSKANPASAAVRRRLADLRAAGWRLALLTNCDRDLIAETERRLAVPIDAVVTAEDVGGYKPGHGHFERFASRFDASRENWVHVAQSHFHDMVPAQELGIRRVWINRHGDPRDPAVADAVLPGLAGLPKTAERVHRMG